MTDTQPQPQNDPSEQRSDEDANQWTARAARESADKQNQQGSTTPPSDQQPPAENPPPTQ